MDIINFSDLIDKGSFDKGTAEVAKMIERITDEVTKAEIAAEDFAKAMGQTLKKEIKELSSTSRQLAKDMADMEKKMAQYKTTTSNTKKVISDYEKENKKLKTSLEKLAKELKDVDKAQKDNKKSTSDTTKETTKLAQSFLGLASGAALIYKGIQGLARQLKAAVDSMLEFEQAMKEVQAISRASSEDLKLLTENANRLGATTEKTAGQIAKLQKELGKLGFNTTEILASTDAIVDLSTATGEDLANSATVAAATLRAFGLEAIEMNRVVDVMAGSFVRSGLDLEKFKESMKLVAPIARATNIDIETTTAMLSKLADAGLSGSLAGTALRNLFSSMADPSEKLVQFLGSLNSELADGVKTSEDAVLAFKELKNSGIDLATAVQMVDVRARPAFFTIMNQIDAVEGLIFEYKDLDGEASKLAETMRDTLTNDIKIAESAFDAMRRNLVEGFSPAMREVAQEVALLSEATRFLITDLANVGTQTNDTREEISFFGSTIKAVTSLFGLFHDAARVYTESRGVEEVKTRMEGTKAITEQMTESAIVQINVLKQLKAAFKDNRSISNMGEVFNVLGEDFSALNQKFVDGIITQEEAEKRLAIQLESKLNNVKSSLQLQQQRLQSIDVELKALDMLRKSENGLNEEQEKRNVILLTEANRLRPLVKEYLNLEETISKLLKKDKIDPFVDTNKVLGETIKLTQKLNEEKLKGELERAKVMASEATDPASQIALEEAVTEKQIELARLRLNNELEVIESLYKNDEDYILRKKLVYEQFMNELFGINQEFTTKIDKIYTESVKRTDDVIKDITKESFNSLDKLADDWTKKKEQQAKLLAEQDKQDKADEEARLREHEQTKQKIIQESARAMQNITRSIFDNRQIARQQELDEIKAWEESMTQIAGDNEQAKLRIKEEAAERERKLKVQQAKDNKAEALFEIAIRTAVAVISALPNIALAAIIGGLGAAQAAVVAARPIPRFEKGTKASPEGVAEVAERGRELIVDGKSGEVRVAENRQYTYLTKNSVVVPNAQTEALLAGDVSDKNAIAYTALKRAEANKSNNNLDYNKLADSFVKGAKSIPQNETIFDENGVRNFVIKGASRIQKLNKRRTY